MWNFISNLPLADWICLAVIGIFAYTMCAVFGYAFGCGFAIGIAKMKSQKTPH